MHFQHPELLYALFLLIIPLIVHLFRLRKFQKEDFTNVKFLKKVIQETRKSSRLKKFLILLTRLLLLSCLILAFAQPFIPASETALGESKSLIYLDNSFSMQARDGQTSAFQKSLNPLLENLNNDNQFGLITNNSEYYDRSSTELRNELQNIQFSEKQANFREIKLKAESYFKRFPAASKDLVIVSDFQTTMDFPAKIDSSGITYHLVKRTPESINNVSLDTVFIDNSNPESVNLKVLTSTTELRERPVSISIFDGENLLGRNSVQFSEERSAEVEFRLQNESIQNGRIEIEDSGLKYDNLLYFNIEESPAINVVIISKTEADFLNRIYTEPEFNTYTFQANQIDFNQLNSANLVILNEVTQLPASLANNLLNANKNGASLVIIPPVEASDYNRLINSFGFTAFSEKTENERLITSISFDHPLLENVFEDRIDNFEYPKVLSSYNLSSPNSILRFQDNRPFLAENNSVYLFTAALNQDNSNFKNSPLIVPVLYQIGLRSLKKNKLYYETSQESDIDIPVKLGKDQVLHMVKDELDLIPQQQNFSNRVEINTGNLALEAGNYQVKNDNEQIANISFNYGRKESDLNFSELEEVQNARIYNSVEEYFSESNASSQITTLWKWFVIFALVFLAIEMLLIKFFK
ncbi:BatA and WFA domain-containing protein [Pontixanthobacter gangjinensis]|uniref:Aerotolerance regulator N-terminal domain-containing protein n=1 Tax=Christiangramia aestuarii TaxID=1028746 RepID=A0A7K1LPE7_9FLAO|nr:BatA domain-containing protein [Christiangramia aestuarii]MUP42667.1 hypothetical protein [Christiangramia aestuarii]